MHRREPVRQIPPLVLSAPPAIGFLTGLKVEAACLSNSVPAAHVAVSAGDPVRAPAMTAHLADNGVIALVSCGMAGGLDPALRPGDIVVGSGVALPDGSVVDTDPTWWPRILSQLTDGTKTGTNASSRACVGLVYGSDAAILSSTAKADLFGRYGSIAVDLESAAVALVAAERGLPFAVVRAIADPADHPVPPLALSGMGPDGEMRPSAVVRGLIGAPWHLPALIRLGCDTRRSLAALRAVPWAAVLEAAPVLHRIQ